MLGPRDDRTFDPADAEQAFARQLQRVVRYVIAGEAQGLLQK